MRRQWLAGVVGLGAMVAAGCADEIPTDVRPAPKGPNLARLGDDGGMEAGGVAEIVSEFSINTSWVPISWSANLSGISAGSCEDSGFCQVGGLVASISPQLDAMTTLAAPTSQFAFMTTADFTYVPGSGGDPVAVTEYRSLIESDGQYLNDGGGRRVRIPGQESYVIAANTPAELVFDYAFMTGQNGPGTEDYNSFAVVRLTLDGVVADSFVVSRNDLRPNGTGTPTSLQAGDCGSHVLGSGFVNEIVSQTVQYPLCTGWRRGRVAIPPATAPRTAFLTAYVSEAVNPAGGFFNNGNATTFALDDLSFESIEDGGGNTGGGTNTAPTAAIDAATGAEGSAIRLHAAAADAEGPIASFAWGAPADCTIGSPTLTSAVLTCADDGTYDVTLRVTDAGNLTTTATRGVVVKNAAPVLGKPLAADLLRAGTPFSAAIAFTDRGSRDTHTALFSLNTQGFSTARAGTVVGGHGSADFGPLPKAGFYDLKVTVTDDDGGKASVVKPNIIVYDRNAGYLRAQGTIASPVGAYYYAPGSAGIASFTLSLEYAAAADQTPSGVVQFVLPNGEVFTGTTFRYLVIDGPNAYAEGCGTLNARPGICFWFHAVDGGATGDRLRFKLNTGSNDPQWVIFYDNAEPVPAGQPDPESLRPDGGFISILKY